ncbi:hypothetical protein [uncultured Fusobacterium sp.]|jgi:hypothetical protein|uniref:hypothetical protein n=1 Tax=uncultured Fusobacterium sp. TaxID=159267 RepID=UPI0015A6EF52|nr:hypothetical protein [uncultured Fusobacterium sp.]
MLLDPQKSKCKKNDKIIVSKDLNTDRKHVAENLKQNNVRQYQLDGVIIKNQKTCDYLVLNDDSKKAFFIELKGRNVSEAISQFEGAILKTKSELLEYSLKFRIISSKSNTHEIRDSKIIKFQKTYKDLKIKTKELRESIE